MSHYDAIIIGAGLGGLVCGQILSREGMNVLLLEAQDRPGGNLLSFTRHGCRFDTGVHYVGAFGPGQPLRTYWDYLGLTGVVKPEPLDPECFDRVILGDRSFSLPQGFERFTERLSEQLPGHRRSIERYVEMLERVAASSPLYRVSSWQAFPGKPFHSISAAAFLETLGGGHEAPSPGSVLAGNNYLYGGCRETPLSTHALIQHSLISGACRFPGGTGAVAEALTRSIGHAGGRVLTGHRVTRISRPGGDFHVTASTGETFQSSRVIAAIHPRVALEMTDPVLFRPVYRKRVAAMPDTPAPFALFLALKPGAFPHLRHNIHYHASLVPWDEDRCPAAQWPSTFMLATSAGAPGQAHADSAVILSYMPPAPEGLLQENKPGQRAETYKAFKAEKAGQLLALAGSLLPGLKEATAHADAATGHTWQDYTGTPGGSLYGIRKDAGNPEATAMFARTPVSEFYFTGQSTNLHGVLGVTTGAVLTCGEIVGTDYLLEKIRHG